MQHGARLSVILIAGMLMNTATQAALVVAEGERFSPEDAAGWHVIHQDDSYASHTYGGMWVTHGGLISAPSESSGSVAVQQVTIPEAGTYRVWSKYQAPPYFNYDHQIEVVQNGKILFSHVYGKLDAKRFWSFSAGLHEQIWWFWGMDHDAAEAPATAVKLAAGPAEVRLTSVEGKSPRGDAMVDFVVLTTEKADTYTGFKPYKVGSPFCLDALAATELYIRFKNTSDQPAKLTVRKPVGHFQPNYSGFSVDIPGAPVAPGQLSPWIDIGPKLTLVHNEGLLLSLPGTDTIPVQFALDSKGHRPVGDLEIRNGDPVTIPMDITWNTGRNVRASRDYAAELIDLARSEWRTANKGRKPADLLYYGAFRNQADWCMALKDALGYNTLLPDKYPHAAIDGYFQHCFGEQRIVDFADKLGAEKKSFRVLSFGDEIHLGHIRWDDPAMQETFTAWLKEKGLTQKDLGVPVEAARLADRDSNPRVGWYATMFNEEQQFARFRRNTEVARREIGPQVKTGANYSPHGMPQYYGPIYQWIDIFKHNGMTMYWAEDYVFSVAQPPQFISWMFATVRCAIKYNNQKVHFYIMPHAPGQVPPFLRRGMVFAAGAGANHIDNFWVAPQENFTENYVAWDYTDMFRTLHESIYDSAEAEPYRKEGAFRQAKVAIVISKATDHNERRLKIDSKQDPFMARCGNAPATTQATVCRRDQQLLYLALRHAQHAVDLVTEEDILEGRLKDYAVVYFAGKWIDHRVPPVLANWVEGGGVLYACAGIGQKNEFDEPDKGMANLLGLESSALKQDVYVIRPYLELPLVKPIDTITMGDARIPAIAIRQSLVPAGAEVIGTWSDGSAAVTERDLGKGKAYAVGTAAGHTYLKTGVRTTPWARGGRKMVYNPTGFDPAATELALLGINTAALEHEVRCSNHYVEALVIDSPKGALLTLVNWDNAPIEDLDVAVRLPFKPAAIRSVQQQNPVEPVSYESGVVRFSTDLEWADYFLIAK